MPVYLCKPGWASPEPWRHGVQVYAYPCRIDDGPVAPTAPPAGTAAPSSAARTEPPTLDGAAATVGRDAPPIAVAAPPSAGGATSSHPPQQQPRPHTSTSASTSTAGSATGIAVRRVRHAEVVLVDEVREAYGRHWLRLRWPGPQGGFAGYIALGAAPPRPPSSPTTTTLLRSRLSGGHRDAAEEGRSRLVAADGRSLDDDEGESTVDAASAAARAAAVAAVAAAGEGRRLRSQLSEVSDQPPSRPPTPPGEDTIAAAVAEGRGNDDDAGTADRRSPRLSYFSATASGSGGLSDGGDGDSFGEADMTYDGNGRPTSSSSTSPLPSGLSSSSPVPRILCESTGLYFPSSSAMELLAAYDDGLHLSSLSHSNAVVGLSVGGGGGGTTVASSRNSVGLGPTGGGMRLSLSGVAAGGGVMHPEVGEPVFCRICREGLHDVNYDLDAASGQAASRPPTEASVQPPPPAIQPGADQREGAHAAPTFPGGPLIPVDVARQVMDMGQRRRPEESEDSDDERRDGAADSPTSQDASTGAGLSHRMLASQAQQSFEAAAAAAAAASIVTHHPTAENPLLAPCECAGSMAFVHYLCVEQWRCRSHHPAARDGLNCETCGGAYTLPPPPSRPASRHGGPNGIPAGPGVFAEEDWLEAMPPHVLHALRRPHPWWQIGAAIVRRRWLRPVAPVIMSPVVALYCRARRTLKKRGVSRRRWACSLCRRRARWKCVRCLRSYYCSRQCQNVSWHIVHKHVCYKPARFWWSVVLYSIVTLLVFPGILKDPLIYDLGFSFIPASFLVMGIIGGGVATALKRGLNVDIRGRLLELVVVLLTAWLTMVSWGLVWAFFGENAQCWGTFGTWTESSVGVNPIFALMRSVLFRPAQVWFRMWDRAASKTGPIITRWICSVAPDALGNSAHEGCFETIQNANPDFFLSEYDGGKCAADLITVTSCWTAAAAIIAAGSVLKKWERGRRAAARAGGRRARVVGDMRPHQD